MSNKNSYKNMFSSMNENECLNLLSAQNNSKKYLDPKKDKRVNIFYCLFLMVALFVCGFFNRTLANNIVKADEYNGLMNNYALYSFDMNDEIVDILDEHNLSLTIDDGDFSGIASIYLLSTSFAVSNIGQITFNRNLTVNIELFDTELSTDGLDVPIDYLNFNFNYFRNAKALMIPNQYVNEFDNLLEIYTYSSDNLVYPLSMVISKVTESSEQYNLINNIVPFNEILRLGTNWYIYKYGTYNQGYYDGFDVGYNQALSLSDSELSYMGRLFNSIGGSLKSVLGVKILGEITIGNIVFVPLFIGMLILLWKIIGKG